MLKYWLELTGQSLVYFFAMAHINDPSYGGPDKRQMFWSMLADTRKTIRESLKSHGSPGAPRYAGNFRTSDLHEVWYGQP